MKFLQDARPTLIMSDRKLEMGNFQVRNVNDLETGEATQEVLQMDKCQHKTSDNLSHLRIR